MDKELPAKAIAALLPHKNIVAIKEALEAEGRNYVYIAFECHKALINTYTSHSCEPLSLQEFEGGGWVYEYGYLDRNSLSEVLGKGKTHEEAIFNAVLDWFRKAGARQ